MSLDPIEGHEQGGTRPALVLSVNAYNNSAADKVVVVPITTRYRNIPTRIPICAPDGGLKEDSYALCEDVRSISIRRLSIRKGQVSEPVMEEVEKVVRRLLGL